MEDPALSTDSYSKHAETWNCFSGDRSDEVNCWTDLARRYGTVVLAPMAATGEVAAALARCGFAVTAVDLSREMVAEGARRHGSQANLTFIDGDVRSLRLPRNDYEFAFIGTADFHHLLTASDRESALMSLNAHMRPGGGLGLELWFPSEECWTTPWQDFEPLRPPANLPIRVWKKGRTVFDAGSRIVSISQECFIEREGRTEQFVHSIRLQLFDRGQLAAMLTGAGFAIVKEYGSYASDPWTPHSPRWIVEAAKGNC